MTSGGGTTGAGGLVVVTLVVGGLGTNCYVLRRGGGQATGAALVDPGGSGPEIIDYLDRNGLEVGLVLLTHGHSDHLGALPDILSRWPGAAVAISPHDLPMLSDPALNLSVFVGGSVSVRPRQLRPLSAGDRLEFDGLELEIIAAPGHTRGGVCLYFALADRPVLFSGDTLFAGSVGRTDLPGGSWSELAASLRRLALLPPGTLVYPGHGPATTIGAETRSNPYVSRALNA